MPLNFFHGKLSFAAQLTEQHATLFMLNCSAVIAVVDLFLRNLFQAVTSQMEARIALITVKDLIGVIVEATEAYFTVSLEEL